MDDLWKSVPRNRSVQTPRARRAMALLVVMVLTMLIALGAYRYSFTMQAEYRVARIQEERVHARLAAASGLELVAAILEDSLARRNAMGGVDSNPALFQHVIIGGEQAPTQSATQHGGSPDQWFVSLLSPAIASDDPQSPLVASSANAENSEIGQALGGVRFGLENESAKLHVPTLLKWERQFPGHARAALMRLPHADASQIDGWLRSQGVSSAGGLSTESRLMDRLQSGSSSTSLQASRDWFRLRWLGGDLNQNYRLDELEMAISESLREGTSSQARESMSGPVDLSELSASGSIAPAAWQRYLTWVSGERNESLLGQPRVYLNGDNLSDLHRQLLSIWPAELANFVIAMRQYGPGQPRVALSSSPGGISNLNSSSGAATPGANTSSTPLAADTWTPDLSKPPSYRLTSVLDLVDVSVSVPVETAAVAGTGGGSSLMPTPSASVKKQLLSSPFSSAMAVGGNYNDRLFDESTIELARSLVGRVDIRHAPLEVLMSVPGVDQPLAEQIVQQRSVPAATADMTGSSTRNSIAWLLTEGLVDLARLKQLEPYLTCRSDVYRTQSVGYRDATSAVYRCTAVVDACQRPARIVDYQVWHAWDRGFPVESFAPALR